MAALSINQVAALAIGVGLSGETAAIATAIAMGESGGDPNARGDTTITTATWGPSIGLWQVRSLNAQRGSGGERDELALTNPQKNAQSMKSISANGTNWRPWSVYTSGKYRTYLAQARLAVASPGAVPAGLGGAAADAAAAATTAAKPNLFTDPGTWSRVGLFVLGGVLVSVTLYKATGAGNIITNVVPVGRIAKGLKAVT